MMNKFWKTWDQRCRQDLMAAVVLLILVGVTFSNGLRGDFLIDDYQALTGNDYVRDISFLGYHFLHPSADLQYRPLTYASLSIFFQLFGYDPFGYHAVNLLFFYLSCLMVYQLIKGLLRDRTLAFVAAVLFAVHPAQGMIVNYVSATIFAFQIIAMSASLLLLQKWLDTKKPVSFVLSLFFFLISLLSHESAITLPLYVAAVLYFLKKSRWPEILWTMLPYGLTAGAYLLFRMSLLGVGKGVAQAQAVMTLAPPVYIAAFTKLIAWYIKCLLTLQGIVLIWIPRAVSKPVWFWDGIFILLVIGVIVLTRAWGRKDPKAFALWWFLLGILPIGIACILEPEKGMTIRPHWLFFANIGFFLLLAMFLTDLKKTIGPRAWLILMAGIVAILMVSSRIYNHLWGNPIRYNQYWLKESPMLSKHYLADAYRSAGDYTAARDLYLNAYREFGSWQSLVNLGAMDLKMGQSDSAMTFYEEAIHLDPANALAYKGLAAVQQSKGLWPQAAQSLHTAIQLEPSAVITRRNLAEIYERLGDERKAVALYEDNLADGRYDPASLVRLMIFYLENLEKEKALSLSERVFKERDAQVLVNVGSVLAKNRMPQEALPFYVRALQVDPRKKEAYLEMGKIYGNAEKWDAAIQIWEEGLKLCPDDADFLGLIGQAVEFKKKAP